MGIPIATALSLDLNIPFTVIRKRSYGFEDEICVDSKTGYSNCKLYINGIEKKDKIVIVDDVISTGGTLDSIVSTLEDLNVDIKGIFVIVQKKSKGKKSDLKIKSLITGQ
jgi:adenine phosphoribosyltransferase